MKIKKEEIENFASVISKLELPSNYKDQKAMLFFPIEEEGVKEERDTGVILLETKKEGFAKFIIPGLSLAVGSNFESTLVHLSYATVEYKIPFSVKNHVSYIQESKFTEDELKYIDEHECYLVPVQQMLINFNY
jgi:hypothetical protein